MTTRPKPISSTGGESRHDAGAVAITLAVCMVALIALAGLVVDGSRAMHAQSQAHDLAGQAARAAAGQLSDTSLRQGTPSQVRVNPSAAIRAAQDFLNVAGASGTVNVGAREVTVTATVPARTAILSIVGIRDVDGTSTATALILHGTTEGTR